MGRRAVEIDLDQLELLASLGCTQADAAAFFKVSQPTISKKLKQRKYREAWERGLGKGNISLRRWQFRIAEKGSVAMLIWLGKQRLGQRQTPRDDQSCTEAQEYLASQKGTRGGGEVSS